jgi:hypothetical protein
MAETELKRAIFKPVSGNGAEMTVHFNPVSLQISIQNTLEEQGQDKKQYVTKSVAKLKMDLIFDTTHNGEDVRIYTEKVARFMEPEERDNKKIPSVVLFEWGTYKFQGLIESYQETIDFFAPTGVPLRATVNLTLARQEKVFEPDEAHSSFDRRQALQPDEIELPPARDDNATGLGARGGNPRAGRAIAARNNFESMRFAAGAAVTVSGGVELGAPVAFSTGPASFGAGASAGIGGGVGVGGGISAGISAGIGASGGAGVSFGGSASAGVTASAGAFAGLRAGTSARATLDTARLLRTSESFTLATDEDASFQLGGQARIEGSTSLSAEVGAQASLKARLQFE